MIGSGRGIGAGAMLQGSFATVAAHPAAFAGYFAFLLGLAILGSLPSEFDFLAFGFIPTFLVAWFGQFLLFNHLLVPRGEQPRIRWGRLLPFMVQGVVVSIAVMVGMQLFVIPALLIGARWMLAPAFLIEREESVFTAIGSSWDATSGATFPATLALTAMTLISMVVFVLVVQVLDFEGSMFAALHIVFLGAIPLCVATYRLLDRDSEVLGDVFA